MLVQLNDHLTEWLKDVSQQARRSVERLLDTFDANATAVLVAHLPRETRTCSIPSCPL